MSTGIGNGIATPHIILQNGDKTCMALGICKDGIADYESLDSKPVRIVFMIIAGKDQKLTHLKVLAAISSLFFDGRLKAAFLAANDPQTCLEILARRGKVNTTECPGSRTVSSRRHSPVFYENTALARNKGIPTQDCNSAQNIISSRRASETFVSRQTSSVPGVLPIYDKKEKIFLISENAILTNLLFCV